MNNLIRVAAVSNKIVLGDAKATANTVISILGDVRDYSPDIIVFPSFTLTGSQLGDLEKNPSIIDAYEDALDSIFNYTKKLSAYLIISGISIVKGTPVNFTYAVYHGEIVACGNEQDRGFVLEVSGTEINVITQSVKNIMRPPESLIIGNFDINILCTNLPATAGDTENISDALSFASKTLCCGFTFANGGVGDTSFPYLHRGVVAAYECGKPLGFKQSLSDSIILVTDFDRDIIHSHKCSMGLTTCGCRDCYSIKANNHVDVMRILDTEPYLPSDSEKRRKYLLDLFKLQTTSLAVRIENIGTQKLTMGVSGGLDSTLALLVCCKSLQLLGLPSSNITAVTMSGFGTSGKTYDNAIKLMNALGCTVREIPIKDSVLQHFSDIGHDPKNHNVVFENAQARERTQILLDIANGGNGIVVGTGDLSESALGFSTFAGDHMASYNVNICVTKTAIRYLVTELAATKFFSSCKDILLDILDTPISPELLPPDETGNIMQKTETILGAYELHDFFLYYFVRYSFEPSKIHAYALKAFAGKYDSRTIKNKLEIFIRRFCAGQFKRSCAPDAAVITELNLCGAEFTMPSDINADILLEELEKNC